MFYFSMMTDDTKIFSDHSLELVLEFAVRLIHDDNNDVIVWISFNFFFDLLFPFFKFVGLPFLDYSDIIVTVEVSSKILPNFDNLVINPFNHKFQVFRVDI